MLINGKRNTMEMDVSFEELLSIIEKQGRNYIYRGQSNSEHLLEPSGFREKNREIINQVDLAIKTGVTELIEESVSEEPVAMNPINRAMRLFYTLAARQGLDLPKINIINEIIVDPNQFITSGMSVGDETTFAPYLELCALAQHYGFPTYLLDWSLDPYCALYFSVSNALKGMVKEFDKTKSCSFSLWMLNVEQLKGENKPITVFTFNHHTNLNLIAQRGVFTYVSRENLNDSSTILDKIESVNEEGYEPSLIKYNISYEDVLKAMDHLIRIHKTAETFFPGYEGVVRSMKDYAYYQDVKKKFDNINNN